MSKRSIAAAWLVAALLATPALAQDGLGWMAAGPGRDSTAAACAICHTPNYIRMNSVFLTPEQWKAEVTKMRVVFGAPIDDDTAKEIVDYLAAHYAAPPH